MVDQRFSLSVVTTVGVFAFLMTGCSPAERADGFPLNGGQPGAVYGEVPPRLVLRDGFRVWNDPSAFGPVPLALQKTGDAVCATMNTPDKPTSHGAITPRRLTPMVLSFRGAATTVLQGSGAGSFSRL